MPRATFFMPFLCHNFSQIFEVSDFFQNLTRKILQKLIFYLINSKLTKSRTFESNTAPPHISNFPRTQGFKSRTNWRYPAHSGNSGRRHSHTTIHKIKFGNAVRSATPKTTVFSAACPQQPNADLLILKVSTTDTLLILHVRCCCL